MPTPDDAIVSPVEHEDMNARTTCPPDESRSGDGRALNELRHSSHDSNATHVAHVPTQLPTPPPQDCPEHAQTPADSHTKPSGAEIETPNRDIPTPMTATDDGTEEQRTSQASPLTATAPVSLLAHHLSSPFPAHRVRYCKAHATQHAP